MVHELKGLSLLHTLEECVEKLTSGIIWKGSGLSDGPFTAMLTMGDLKAVWKQLKLLGNYLEIKKKKKVQ